MEALFTYFLGRLDVTKYMVADMVADLEVEKVAELEKNKIADMELVKVADMEVDKVRHGRSCLMQSVPNLRVF